jgi:hypothetical protein
MDLRAITDLEGGRLQSGKLFGPVGPVEFPPISSWRQPGQSIGNRLWVHLSLSVPSPLAHRALHMRFSESFVFLISRTYASRTTT